MVTNPYINIAIRRSVYEKLKQCKVHPNQSFSEAIEDLIESMRKEKTK